MSSLKTQERAANWRAIFDNLRGVEFNSQAIGQLLGLSDTAGYKYRIAMAQAGLLEQVNTDKQHNESAIYQIKDDQAAIDAFMETACGADGGVARMGKRIAPPSIPGVTVHVLRDDFPVYVHATKVEARRDPLVMALFGPAPSLAGVA